MIVKQVEQGVIILGKMDSIMEILGKAIEAGYGNLPAFWSLNLYLNRN